MSRIVRRTDDGGAERVQHARARAERRRVERQPVAEHDAPLPQRGGELAVRRHVRSGIPGALGALLVPIGFREDDVEGDDRRARVPQPGNQPANDVAAPRPLTDRGQAAFVDVDDDDAGGWRRCLCRPQEQVVGRVIQSSDERRPVQHEHRREDDGQRAGEDDETPTRGTTRPRHGAATSPKFRRGDCAARPCCLAS